jgi:pyridoxamine 5'-phosphate oxidase
MDIKEYADFANENRTCYLSSVEGDQPRVRCLGMWYADETGFYFQAQSVKAMCKQLQKKCIKERPFVKNFGITEPNNPLLAVFHLYTGEAYFWTMADSMKEAQIPRAKF